MTEIPDDELTGSVHPKEGGIDPHEVILKLLVGKDVHRMVRVVLEVLPNGTIAINDEIRDRQVRGYDSQK